MRNTFRMACLLPQQLLSQNSLLTWQPRGSNLGLRTSLLLDHITTMIFYGLNAACEHYSVVKRQASKRGGGGGVGKQALKRKCLCCTVFLPSIHILLEQTEYYKACSTAPQCHLLGVLGSHHTLLVFAELSTKLPPFFFPQKISLEWPGSQSVSE